ncbi:hypothetical protein Taro_029463 [Colocasia esculenta]|uniref:Uncharacterized protein n=1 Tax=Colocasia esculenta TaxID=4460 RepID=A0A843VLG6_COLES|nr:hypothetical protein [Colocasia esculenta]
MGHPMGLPLCWCRDRGVRRDTRRGVCPDRCRDACSCRDRVVVRTLRPVATGLLSRCPSPSRWYRDGLGGRYNTCVASGVPWFRLGCRRVPQGWLALRTFRWGTRQVTWLRLVIEGDRTRQRCQEGRVCLIID